MTLVPLKQLSVFETIVEPKSLPTTFPIKSNNPADIKDISSIINISTLNGFGSKCFSESVAFLFQRHALIFLLIILLALSFPIPIPDHAWIVSACKFDADIPLDP